MGFLALGKVLLDLGLPVLGAALGIPEIAPAAAELAKAALGMDGDASADDIAAAARINPEALKAAEAAAAEKWKALAAIAVAQADVGKAQVQAVNASIQAETAARAPDGWWGNWRSILAYELAIECPLWALLIMYSVALDKAGVSDLINASGLIMAWWGARFGVLGVHVWTGSNERQVAMTGSPVGGVAGGIANLVKAVTGKR